VLGSGLQDAVQQVDDFRERSVNRFHGSLAEVRLREPPLVVSGLAPGVRLDEVSLTW
jgi:hypothetical protein